MLQQHFAATTNLIWSHLAMDMTKKRTVSIFIVLVKEKIVYLKSNNKVWKQAIQVYRVKEKCDYIYTSVHFRGKIFLINNLNDKQQAMEVWFVNFFQILKNI